MKSHINSYIEFERLFKELLVEQMDIMTENYYVCDHYARILDFKDRKYEIQVEDCKLDDRNATFVFVVGATQPTESNPDIDGSLVVIIYNFLLDEFISCEID